MTDRALRELERAAGHDPLARALLTEAHIRAGSRDPRRDPQAGDVLSIGSPTWTRPDGTPCPIVREVVRVEGIQSDGRAPRMGWRSHVGVYWRYLAVPDGARDRVDPDALPRRCSLAAWRRWAKHAAIVDRARFDDERIATEHARTCWDRPGQPAHRERICGERRFGENGHRCAPAPCDTYRPFCIAPAYCWCGWIDTKHAGAPAEESP